MQKLMSKLILPAVMTICLLLAMQSESFAGAVPEGLAGVPWGATRDQVNKIMSEKGFKQDNSEPSPALVFYGSFANRMCFLKFFFKGNAFYEGDVEEKFYDYPYVEQAYNHFVQLVTEKYGQPQERSPWTGANSHKTMRWDKWKFHDSASSDVYTIIATTSDGLVEFPSGRTQLNFHLTYTAESLKSRLKEDGL